MGIHYPPGARARFTKALGQLQEQGELWDFAGLLNIEIGDGDYTDHELRQRIVNFVYAESFSQEGQADGRRQLVANESSESLAGSTPAPSAIWDQVLHRARRELPKNGVALYFAPCEPVEIRDGQLVVESPPPIHAWLARKYARWIGDTVRANSDLTGIVLREKQETE